MKKIVYLILAVLFLFPVVAKADAGAPEIKHYTVVSKSGQDETYYDWKLNAEGTVPAGTEVIINYEEKINGEFYGFSYDIGGYIKLSDFKVVKGQEVEETEAKYVAKVFEKEGLTVYSGPSYINEEVGTLSYGDDIKSGEYNFSNSWLYVEKGNIKGYVEGGVGILTKGKRISLATSKVYEEYYVMDRMYRGSMYVYDNGEYKLEADTGAAYDGTSKAVTTKECKVYKDGLVEWTENDTLYGEVVGTIPAGTTLNILYDGGRHYITYYVENDGIKGWIKEDYPNSCIEFVENQDTDPTETIEEPKETIEETYVTDVAVDVVEDNKEFKFTTKEIVIGSICLGAVIVLTAIVTIVLVNKKKKN